MNVWLWEKALKEGLAGVNGGQLCQLLHPNEAALSFTKPQLITLQAISEQDCLSAPLPPPHPFSPHPPPPTVNNIMTRRADERRSDWERGGCREEVRCCHHASLSRGRSALRRGSSVGGIAAQFGVHKEGYTFTALLESMFIHWCRFISYSFILFILEKSNLNISATQGQNK